MVDFLPVSKMYANPHLKCDAHTSKRQKTVLLRKYRGTESARRARATAHENCVLSGKEFTPLIKGMLQLTGYIGLAAAVGSRWRERAARGQ